MAIIVMKFGGSCLKDAESFKNILNIIEIYKDHKRILVISAFNGITDLLLDVGKKAEEGIDIDKNIAFIEKKHNDVIDEIFTDNEEYANIAKDYIEEKISQLEDALIDINEFGFEPYYQDYVLSFGEIFSTYILHLYLKINEYNVVFIPSTELIITDDNFRNAFPLYNYSQKRIKKKMVPLLDNPNDVTIFCITGFIGRNKIGYITTLGRGGSDYTATILAHIIHDTCKFKDIKVVLWKNVDGLLISDPKYIKNYESKLVKILDYNEAKELAFFGAKILHPKCLEAIEPYSIPLEIRNFNKPLEKSQFTIISEKTDKSNIKGISTIEEAAMITVSSGSMVEVPGVLAKIFDIMGDNKINVSLVAQSSSEINTTFVVEVYNGEKAVSLITENNFFKNFFDIKIEYVGIIAVIGLQVLDTKIKARIFSALSSENINVKSISQSSEGLNISMVINKHDIEKAVNTLHEEFH